MSKRHKARTTTMTETPVDNLADMVADLTGPIHHREHYSVQQVNGNGSTTWVGVDHATTSPSLIVQLHRATFQAAQTDVGGRPGYMSKPTARLDAIDTLAKIDAEAARWVQSLGKQYPGDTSLCVRLLGSLMPSADRSTRSAVEHDVKRWWTWSRILAGWESPPWKPASTCPLCAHRGGLRVRLDTRSAVCNACWETWSPETIGLLADHIRSEAESAPQVGVSPVTVGSPCHCRTCDPEYRFWRLCPQCGHVEAACAKTSDHRFPCTGPVV